MRVSAVNVPDGRVREATESIEGVDVVQTYDTLGAAVHELGADEPAVIVLGDLSDHAEEHPVVWLREHRPRARVVVVIDDPTEAALRGALAHQADGVVLTDASSDLLRAAIEAAIRGEVLVDPRLTRMLLDLAVATRPDGPPRRLGVDPAPCSVR